MDVKEGISKGARTLIIIDRYGDANFNDFISFSANNPGSYIGFDTETTGLDTRTSDLLLVQVKIKDRTYIIDVNKLGKKFTKYLVELLVQQGHTFVIHNSKFDIKVILNSLGVLITNSFDTMWAEVMIHQGLGHKKFISLSELVKKYLNIDMDKGLRLSFTEGELIEFSEEQLEYAMLDVEYLDIIRQYQVEKMGSLGILRVFLDVECPLNTTIAVLENNGIKIDIEGWKEILKDFEANQKIYYDELIDYVSEQSKKIEGSALDVANRLKIKDGAKTKKEQREADTILDTTAKANFVRSHFNMNSTYQIQEVFSLLDINLTSTDAKVLEEYKDEHEFVRRLLKYRDETKKLSTYGESFLSKISTSTGRLHTELNNLGAQSGRFSSSKPNLQNIPRDAYYRNKFIAEDGYYIIATDYSQQEYRLAGAITREPKIIQAYKDGMDMHTMTAAIVYNKDPQDVLKDERTRAKSINFAILYGSSEYGLAKNLKVGVDEARKIIKDFYDGYPVLSAFKAKAEEYIVKNRYSTTLLGRKRFWKEQDPIATPQEIEKYRASMRREGFNHCVDYETQCLTKNGWLSGNDIRIGDEILTKNPVTGVLEWNEVEYITRNTQPTVEFGHKGFSAVTTKGHRWLVDTKGGLKSVFKTTEALSTHGDDRIHRVGEWSSGRNQEWSDNELAILGFVLTDGTHHGKNALRICQTKEHTSKIIESLLSQVSHSSRINQTGQKIWSLHVSDLTKKIRNTFPNKTLTRDFIFSLSKEQATILFDNMLLGDGNLSGRLKTFWAGSKERAEMFQLLAYIVGHTSSIRSQKPRDAVIHKTGQTIHGQECFFVLVHRRDRTQVNKHQVFDGGVRDVWCPTVKNGTFVARRLGNIYITGNCIQGTGADVTKMALNVLQLESPFDPNLFRVILQVHDEILVEAHESIKDEAIAFIENSMRKVFQPLLGEIPAVVETSCEKYWRH